jgi:multidrug transporter EmrE-like cation transporter
MQQGPAGILESIDWAIRAAGLGAPWQAVHTFNNAVANVSADPQIAERLPDLLQWALPWIGGVDVVSQGWNLIAQGQPGLALKLMTTVSPWPLSEPQLKSLGEQGSARIRELDGLLSAARQTRDALDESATTATNEITKAKDDITTSAKQAGLLVTTVLSDATNALYKADASRNEKESKGAWIAGLTVLAIAALVAVLPVALHYLHVGPNYSTAEVIGVHLTSTVALGTFSGVLLARARSRDRAAQRSYDLSTAMGTMISYSNQISNPTEKERFMMSMGQVVLQAHLASGSGPKTGDDTLPGILAIANAVRSTNSSGPTP